MITYFDYMVSAVSILVIDCTFDQLEFGTHGGFVGINVVLNVFPNFVAVVTVCCLLGTVNLARALITLMVYCDYNTNLNFRVSGNFFSAVPETLSRTTAVSNTAGGRVF